MSSSSDRDLSESSNSPISYTLRESPYSSPSQQVPQLTSNLTELTCAENSFHYVNIGKLLACKQIHFRLYIFGNFVYVFVVVEVKGYLLNSLFRK